MKPLLPLLALAFPLSALAGTIPSTPLGVAISAKPMTLIVAGRDHKMFYEAYNDASDIDGDGVLDIHFKPSITYFGLFDSNLCYSYNGGEEMFSPTASAVNGMCVSGWSGNWLNYVTTSRIDALRKVLYGGYREIDENNRTVLRRAYIPQDAHSWAKEYTSEEVDGYDISDYTPLSKPRAGSRHFFGNLTAVASVNCGHLNDCSNRSPLLSIVRNTSKRVWEWASKESPVLDDSHGGSRENLVVRVSVCTPGFHDGCKEYPSGGYKPVGLLHDYGEDGAMLFGLLTGSYNKNTSGGVLRKVVSSFQDEIDPETGIFTNNSAIVASFDSLRIRGYNDGAAHRSYNPFWEGAWVTTRPMVEGEFVDWGNPIAEMMYEGMRYFAGKSAPTGEFYTSGDVDAEVGLAPVSWDDPYSSTSAAKAAYCAKPNMLVMSDINPSYDSDQLPGSYFGGLSGDLPGLNVQALANEITAAEGDDVTGLRFIGQSGTDYDGAPTAKSVTSLGQLRGLAPEEPTKEGSYYSASVAYYGKTTDLNDVQDRQTVDSFYVALASPLPQFEFPVGGGSTVTLVPFAKSVGGCLGIDPDADFQPTNQIVDFYVYKIANLSAATADPGTNGGRPYVKFAINYEDVEQAADHDMDAIVEYEISLQSNGKLKVDLNSTYASGCIVQHAGYIISGTTEDGVYLVVTDADTDEGADPDYHLDSPNTTDDLPLTSSREFTPGGSAATLLRDPLWYAAKWGGFVDSNDNNQPDLQSEWDADADGVPDTYFLVDNPTKLKESLSRAFDSILARGTLSASNVSVNSTSIRTDSLVFQAVYNTDKWSGNLLAYGVDEEGVEEDSTWEAADQIPSVASRKIFTRSGGSIVSLTWNNLTPLDQTAVGSEDILNYVRGDRGNEKQNGGVLRDRGVSVLGDIVHSSPYYVKDTNTLYVGANDGLLHGFDVETGVEVSAYLPSALMSKLGDFADPLTPHTYLMDGEIAVSSRSDTGGQNLLVATLGRGGKGLFSVNVTDSSTYTGGWEYFDATDRDLGYMLGKPIIAKMNNGSMAVIIGNGYNSTDGKAVLYIFDLSNGDLLRKLDTEVGGDNGLATPGVFDNDGDGDVDFIYAGDLRGNLWKFDVSGSTPGTWAEAFTSGGDPAPLFTATDTDGNSQPITAPVTVAVNTVVGDPNHGDRYVFFGTGSYIFSADPTDAQVQSWYGLIDTDEEISSRDELVQRRISQTGTAGGYPVRSFAPAASGDMVDKKGWYLDWQVAGEAANGERVVTTSKLLNLIEPVLLVSSIIPREDPCLSGGTGYLNLISPFTGGSVTNVIIDTNDDGSFNDGDNFDDNIVGSIDPNIGMPGEAVLVGDRLVVGGSIGEIASLRANPGGSIQRRLMWREIVK